MGRDNDNWFACPVCGEVVPDGSLACPGCGADDETGWSDEAQYDDLDLPVYENQHEDELEDQSAGPRGSGRQSRRYIVVVVLVGVMILLMVLGRI